MALTKVTYSMISASPINVMDYIPPAEHAAIYARTSTYDATANIQAAIDAGALLEGANIIFPAGKFNVSNTIFCKSYVNIYGIYGETPNSGITADAGTLFNWTGGNTGIILNCFNMRQTTINGFCIEGNGATGVTAILYDSDNDPSAAECTFQNFAIRECFLGVQWGTGGLPTPYAAQANFYTFTIWSNVPGSKGFVINSGNVGQQALIEQGGIQVQDISIDIVVCNLLQIRRVFSGGTPATCGFRVGAAPELTFEGCSSENRDATSGNITANSPFLCVVPPSAFFQQLDFCINLIGNQMNNPVLLTAPVRINSIGNNFGYCYTGTPATVLAAATGTATLAADLSRVVSVNDGTQLWQTGFPLTTGWQPSDYLNLTNINPDGSTFYQGATAGLFPIETKSVDRGWSNIQTAVNGGIAAFFTVNNTNVGSITTNATTTAYVTSSDYRLKKDVQPMENALAIVDKLKPVLYTWKTDGSKGQGFIAHELQEVMPECVIGEKDALDENGNPKYQGIDTSFLVATLTAAIQELKAEFDAYKLSHP